MVFFWKHGEHKFDLIIIISGIKKTARNFIFELAIKTHPPRLYGLEKKQEMMSSLFASRFSRVVSVLAELCLYWQSCFISAKFDTHMIWIPVAI